MDRKIALKWARALESGLYDQATGVLRDTTLEKHSFCCLGVLCNLHAKAHPKIAASQLDPDVYLGNESMLPDEVKEWAGLYSCSGEFYGFAINSETGMMVEHGAGSLVQLNDDYCFTFKEIAKVIRKYSDEL